MGSQTAAFCRFLRDRPDDFEFTTFVRAAPRWLASGAAENIALSVGLMPAMMRLIINKLNDLT